VQAAHNLELPAKYEEYLVDFESVLQELEATFQLTVAELGPFASSEKYSSKLDRMQRSLQMQRSSLTVLRYLFAVMAYGEDLLKLGSPVRNTTHTNPTESDEI
jgi:hypothetical protein